MTILPLSNPVLSRGVRTRLLRKGTVRSENVTKSRKEILPRTVRTKNFDVFPKLRKNHLRKLTINRQNIITMTQKVKPDITRKVVNKAYIIRKPAKRGYRSRTTNIRMY